MRVLLRNKHDNTLIAMKVTLFEYLKQEKQIYITGIEEDATIDYIEEEIYESLVKILFTEGKIDLTKYMAEFE